MRASMCDYVRLLRNLCEEHKNAGIIFVECENCEACGILVKNGPNSYPLPHTSHPNARAFSTNHMVATDDQSRATKQEQANLCAVTVLCAST